LNAYRMATNLNRMAYELKRHKLITDQSRQILNEAASNLQSGSSDNWELIITPEHPLEFVQTESDERLKPDIFCKIKASNTGDWPVSSLRLVLRVWSTRPDISFRQEWDSEEVKRNFDLLQDYKRVMFRCHYDSSSPEQYAPIFHLQFGGTPRKDECYWFPHFLELPRFTSPPIDLVLVCERVVASFFPSTYMKLCQLRNWISLIQESEQFFMKNFYEVCSRCINQISREHTLLGYLCSGRAP